ncbi:MAG: sigma-70 family RNA polymerase sigma factor [Planctomycetia bacterium]|nr:sigma-70 family RNA polymerase sigma factor [Planctomycetia bacterium]
MSDERLIQQTLAGDADAFGHLVEKYQDRLYNTVYRIVGTAEDAQDVVQESFLQAYANLSRFRMSSRFYTWLYRIAYNLSVANLAQRKRTVSVEEVFDGKPEQLVDRGEMPEEHTKREEDAAILWKAINRLPEEYRSPLVLREIDNWSYEEIAEILHIPVGTVRSRLHRARNALKEIILRQRDDLS